MVKLAFFNFFNSAIFEIGTEKGFTRRAPQSKIGTIGTYLMYPPR